jgi:hypothetical protein
MEAIPMTQRQLVDVAAQMEIRDHGFGVVTAQSRSGDAREEER